MVSVTQLSSKATISELLVLEHFLYFRRNQNCVSLHLYLLLFNLIIVIKTNRSGIKNLGNRHHRLLVSTSSACDQGACVLQGCAGGLEGIVQAHGVQP